MKRRRIIVAIAVTIALGVEGRAMARMRPGAATLGIVRQLPKLHSLGRELLREDQWRVVSTRRGFAAQIPRFGGEQRHPCRQLHKSQSGSGSRGTLEEIRRTQGGAHVSSVRGGLNEKDGDHILMYFHRPTRYSSSVHPKQQLGRPVMRAWLHWDFMPEAEFQEQLAKTLALVESRQTNNPSQ